MEALSQARRREPFWSVSAVVRRELVALEALPRGSCECESSCECDDGEVVPANALGAALLATDRLFARSGNDSGRVGSTATVLAVSARSLSCANAGDSRCVLVRGAASEDLSVDHSPATRPDEVARVEEAGGVLSRGDVWTQFSTWIAFGASTPTGRLFFKDQASAKGKAVMTENPGVCLLLLRLRLLLLLLLLLLRGVPCFDFAKEHALCDFLEGPVCRCATVRARLSSR